MRTEERLEEVLKLLFAKVHLVRAVGGSKREERFLSVNFIYRHTFIKQRLGTLGEISLQCLGIGRADDSTLLTKLLVTCSFGPLCIYISL